MTFKYLCVLDFEAVFQENPEDTKKPHMEIIEFPSVLYQFVRQKNNTKMECVKVDQFQRFVKTRRIPELNDYCIQQTGITQSQVDQGETFEQVIQDHTDWLRRHLGGVEPTDQNILFVTCGDWDLKTMLPHQLSFEPHVEPMVGSHLKQWCNVKLVYGKFYKVKKVSGMLTMLYGLNLELVGHHHSGIDDSNNIGQVVCEMVRQGCSFAPTGRHGTHRKQLEYDPSIPLNNFEVTLEEESDQ